MLILGELIFEILSFIYLFKLCEEFSKIFSFSLHVDLSLISLKSFTSFEFELIKSSSDLGTSRKDF